MRRFCSKAIGKLCRIFEIENIRRSYIHFSKNKLLKGSHFIIVTAIDQKNDAQHAHVHEAIQKSIIEKLMQNLKPKKSKIIHLLYEQKITKMHFYVLISVYESCKVSYHSFQPPIFLCIISLKKIGYCEKAQGLRFPQTSCQLIKCNSVARHEQTDSIFQRLIERKFLDGDPYFCSRCVCAFIIISKRKMLRALKFGMQPRGSCALLKRMNYSSGVTVERIQGYKSRDPDNSVYLSAYPVSTSLGWSFGQFLTRTYFIDNPTVSSYVTIQRGTDSYARFQLFQNGAPSFLAVEYYVQQGGFLKAIFATQSYINQNPNAVTSSLGLINVNGKYNIVATQSEPNKPKVTSYLSFYTGQPVQGSHYDWAIFATDEYLVNNPFWSKELTLL